MDGQGMQMLIMFGAVFLIMYFFMIRPQQKKQKELKNFRNSLQQGDSVMTIGGIHGKILEVNDTNVLISTEGSGKLRVEKAAVTKQFEAQQR